MNIQDNTRRSHPHRRVEKVLDKMRINYESEWEEFQPYSLDVWIPEFWCAVEIDGPTHSKRKDALRDEALLAGHGVEVLHLDAEDISVEQVEFAVMAFIIRVAPTKAERKRVSRAS